MTLSSNNILKQKHLLKSKQQKILHENVIAYRQWNSIHNEKKYSESSVECVHCTFSFDRFSNSIGTYGVKQITHTYRVYETTVRNVMKFCTKQHRKQIHFYFQIKQRKKSPIIQVLRK